MQLNYYCFRSVACNAVIKAFLMNVFKKDLVYSGDWITRSSVKIFLSECDFTRNYQMTHLAQLMQSHRKLLGKLTCVGLDRFT